MPIIRRTQPRTALYKPSYPIGSTAASLAAHGLNRAQIDAFHPPPRPLRGAGYAKSIKPGRNPLAIPQSAIRTRVSWPGNFTRPTSGSRGGGAQAAARGGGGGGVAQ